MHVVVDPILSKVLRPHQREVGSLSPFLSVSLTHARVRVHALDKLCYFLISFVKRNISFA